MLPRWRIGCTFTGSKHRERGVARAAVTAVLDEIRRAGGGVVEAYPEQVGGPEAAAQGVPPRRARVAR